MTKLLHPLFLTDPFIVPAPGMAKMAPLIRAIEQIAEAGENGFCNPCHWANCRSLSPVPFDREYLLFLSLR
jgi:hypothetical protein